MKYLVAALAALALCLAGCDEVWTRDIDGCRVEIRKHGGVLEITVFAPASGNGEWVTERALAEYLGVARGGRFECPGMTAVAERTDGTGRVLVFHLPEAALRIVKK